MFANMLRKWIAWAAVVLVAVPAVAAEPPTTLRRALGHRFTHISNSKGQQVRVMHADPEEMQQGDPFVEEEPTETPQPIPEPDGAQWQGAWGAGGDSPGPTFEDGGRPMVESRAPVDAGGPPCQDCGCTTCCCTPPWAHRTYLFGEYLYLLPADADMPHANQRNTLDPDSSPFGAVGVVQPEFSSAYRAGFGLALGCNASIGTSYASFRSHATDSLALPSVLGGGVQSLVLFPGLLNTGSSNSVVDAALDIDYQLVDFEYRRLLSANFKHAINYSVGARYAKLSQDFIQIGNFAQPTGTIQTTSFIDFEGVGLRAGLDGEHRLGCTRFAGYGRGSINVLFGEFRSNYAILNRTTTDLLVHSGWNDRRALPILEYEVGLSWTSRNEHWRASGGYYTAFWFNTITTQQFVQAVQANDFVDVGETISFNGFVSRVEYRF